MRSANLVLSLGAVSAVATAFIVSPVSSPDVRAANQAPPAFNCDLTNYNASTGLTSTVEGNVLAVSWNGQGTSQLRARFAIDGGRRRFAICPCAAAAVASGRSSART